MQIRRVVTGHDQQGRAVTTIDDVIEAQSRRAGASAAMIWTTEGFPVDNTGSQDQRERDVSLTLTNGTVFRVVEFAPGNVARVHRTDSVDYAVIMSGEIDMELDEGSSVHLNAGDVLVQRGTIHNWVNNGTQPCQVAFVLIDAKPVSVDGKVLQAQG